MPSLHMILPALAALSSFQFAVAAAVPVVVELACPGTSHPGAPAPNLPRNGGVAELPPPLAHLHFKHATLGRGTQNYTCASPSSTAVSTGAVATLFDISSLAFISPDTSSLTAAAAHQPFNSSTNGLNGINVGAIGPFQVIGNHFFSADGTPVFNLTQTKDKEILFCSKLASISAPATADKGISGSGAVPWLALGDKGGSKGLGEVYRVLTAGGVAPSCAGVAAGATVTVDYAAEYYFYG